MMDDPMLENDEMNPPAENDSDIRTDQQQPSHSSGPEASGDKSMTGPQTTQTDPQTMVDLSNQPGADGSPQMPGLGKSIDTDGEKSTRSQIASEPINTAATAWFTSDKINELLSHWNDIQVQFVDSPCSAVEQADGMIADVSDQVTKMISDMHSSLNQQWINNDKITTEELRITLQKYRSMLNQLLKL